jgi:hypothetical protein
MEYMQAIKANEVKNIYKTRDSAVGIATGYRLDDRGWGSSRGRVKN